MTLSISRRSLVLAGLAAGGMAPLMRCVARADSSVLTGYFVAIEGTPDDPASQQLVVYDLRTDVGPFQLDGAPIEQLLPVPGAPMAFARTEEGLLLVDAAEMRVTPLQPREGEAIDPDTLANAILAYPQLRNPSAKWALATDRAIPNYLVDLRTASISNLATRFGEGEAFFQLADFTLDGEHLLLATSERLLMVDPETLAVVWEVMPENPIRSPRLSPDGEAIAYLEVDSDAEASTVHVVSVADGEPVGGPQTEAGLAVGFAWVDPISMLLWTPGKGSPAEGSGAAYVWLYYPEQFELEGLGEIPPVTRPLEVIGDGQVALVAVDDAEGSSWASFDVGRGSLTELPDLTGMTPYGLLSPETRAVLFGPEDRQGLGREGQAFVAFNLETGAVTTLVEQEDDQFYPPPAISPNGEAVAISMTGGAGEAVWLCDFVTAETTQLDNRLGAIWAPDSQYAALRPISDDPEDYAIEIVDLAGEVIPVLDGAYQDVWVGAP